MQQLLSLPFYQHALNALLTPFYFLFQSKKVLLRFAMLVMSLGMMSVVVGQATVETDKKDYIPGEYVIITGTGWTPGETVTLHFDETPKPSTCLLPHDLTVVADASGSIYNNQFLVKENHRGVYFDLTATGQISGQIAVNWFTDLSISWDGGGDGVNWSDANNWSPNQVPTSADAVTIPNGFNVTVNTAAICSTLVIGTNGANTISISGTNSLTVTNSVNINSPNGGNDKIIAVGGGSFSCGSLTMAETGGDNRDCELTLSSGTVTVSGNITMNGNSSRNAIIFTSNGTLYVAGTITGGTLVASTGKVEYNANGNQNIGVYTYSNLTFSGSGIKTASAAFTATGTTTVNAGVTFAQGSATFTNGGTVNVNGTFQINQGGFASGGTWNYGANGTLIYNNTSGPYGPIDNGHTYWPSSNGPVNVTVQGGGGINMGAARTVAGTFLLVTGTNAVQGTALTLNGITQINGGNFQTPPIYGNSSTLVYNTNYGTSNEWTGGNNNNPVVGAGVPANVTIQSGTVSLSANRGTPGNVLISGGQLNLGSGDLYLGGNFTHNSSFLNNGKAVFFVGNAATQTINASGGGVSFAYLVIDKPSGAVKLQNASFFIDVNGSAGNTFQLLNAGQLDLNGGTLNLNNNGGFIYVNGARTITSTTAFGKVKINAAKSVANNSGTGNLLFDANVRVELYNQMDFGFSAGSISTIAGELEIKGGGFVTTARAPFYANGSTLRYNSGGNYGAGEEWYANSFGEVTGVPFHVEIAAGTSMNFGNANTARELRGNMTLGAGTNFYLSNTAGGDLKIKGNWINNGGTFFYNGRAIFFNGTGAQTISKTGGEIFGITSIAKSSGSVDLLNDLRVDKLVFETGNTANITPAANTLFVFGNASTDVVRTGNGYVNGILKRNLGATGQNYLFPVGKTSYLPLTVHASSGTGELSSEAFETTIVGAVPAYTTLFPNRQWNVTQVSGGPFTYNITLDGTGFTPGTSDAVIVKGDGANPLSSFPATANGNNYTANGVTGFSFFALAAACDPPVITLANQPQSQTVCENQSVSFTVTATGTGVPSYTYQWYKTGNPVALSNGGSISGATTATLTINPVATADAGSYYVIVSRPCGSSTTSSAATLTVKELPEVTTSPIDQTVTYGAAAGFTVVAGGTNITYQWQEKIGAAPFANITDGGIYSGATTATLNLSRPTVAMSGRKYRVLVSGDCSPPATSGEAELVVNAKPITGSITADNKVYDGTNTATILTRTLSGVEPGDVVNYVGGTATFSDKNVGIGKTVTATGLSLSGADAANYTFNTTANTTADITARALTVSATGINKVYDGNTTATVTLSDDRVSGDVLTTSYTTATFDNKNVGTGKTVSVSGISISGTDAGNYTFNTTASTTADITARALTVSATGINKVYDGNTTATVTLSDNRVSGDVLTTSYTTATFDNKNVGTGKTVSVSGISISGTDAANYTFNTTANATADITAKPITGNFTVNPTKVYDGTTSANVLTRTLNDVVGLDDVSLTGGIANYINKHVGNGKTVTLTGMNLTGTDAGNYNLTGVATTTANITQRPINVTAQTDNRMYNGTNSSSVSPIGDALQTGDSYTTQGTQTYNDKHVATGKTMTATGAIINDGNSGNNYFITYVTNTTGVITIRPITVTAVTNTKVYDGNTSALAVPTFPPLQTGDVVSTQPTEVYDNPLVGTGKTLTASGLVINDGNGGNNYSISYVQNFTGVINPASTTTTLITSAGVVRYMDNLTMTAQIKPLNTGSALTGTVEFKIGTVSYGTATVVPIPGATDGSVQAMMIKQVTNLPGSYTVTAIFTSSNTNYSGSTDSKSLTVNPRNAAPHNATGFYTGDGFAWTTGPNTSTATVTMTAVIKDPNSPTGDVRGAKASFFLVNGTTLTPISSAQNLPVGLIDVTDGSVGSASAIVQLNIGSLNSNSFQIAVKITGAYTNNPWDALSQTIVTVSKPVTGGYICGGSTMKNTNSSGYIKGAANLNTDFQFDIQYNSSGTNPKGKVNVLVRSYYDRFGILDSKLHKYFIKTNAIALLAISNPLATGTFSAKANMEEQLDDGTVISVESGATFQMVAFQNGCTQQIAITYHRKAGGIWFSSKWNAATSKTELQNVNTGSKVYVAGGGSCSVAPRTNGLANSTQVDIIPQPADLQFNVKVFGNPTLSTFKLQLQSSNTTEKITLKVYDINGRVVELRQQLLAGQMIELGSAYKQGTYFAEITQGDQRKVVKLIKTAQD